MSYTVIVPSTQRESYANFTIKVTDTIGENLSITEDDLPFNVFIDTKRPRIELVGNVSYSISQGTINPFIPNVTVTDGDPNYSGDFTLNTNATVDTSLIGSVYNYTYTADADTAGNPGESMSRIITITADPITVTSLSIASSSGNNFANTGKIITVTLVTDGTDLGNFTGTLLGRSFTNTTSGGNTTFTTTVLPGDTNGNATFSITVTNSSGNRILVTNDDIADGSFVTIDTVKPLIILNGNSNDTVLQGNNYTDLGANVYDLNNPSYTENVTATTNLNTSLLGVQNITYSALADTAGNVPDSINRTVTVLAKPLGLVTLTITNNNAVNSLYAKAGDFIDLNFVANGTIGSGTVTIASNTIAHISFYDERFVVSYILASSIADTDSLEFTITVTNEDNTTTSTFTEANLTGPSIIIDNTAPTITLVGNNNTIVYTNSSYTDPGATASDSSYASDIQINGVANNFDITKSGNYTFTYTALDDEAGNTGPSIIRNVIVRDAPPINITSLIIVTDDGTYAKAGDNLHLTLNVNDTISNYDAQILNADIARYSPGTTSLYMLATVSSNTITESNAEFTITVTNPNGTTLTVTEDDLTSPMYSSTQYLHILNYCIQVGGNRILVTNDDIADGSFVTIDTVKPLIILNGNSNDTVLQGNNYTDLGANVYDLNNPSYTENVTATTNLNTSLLGVQNITYSALADTAGNVPDSINRTVTVLAKPLGLVTLTITNNNAVNSLYAKAGDFIDLNFVANGTIGSGTVTIASNTIAHISFYDERFVVSYIL